MDAPTTGIAIPVTYLKSWLEEQREFLLPSSAKQRFLTLCDEWTKKPQDQWLPRFQARRPELLQLFVYLETIVERTTSISTLSAIDDELFFFYVLRVQAVWTHVAKAKDDAKVPFDPIQQWFWMFGDRPEQLIDWTVLTMWLQRKLPNPPAIWRVPLPSDIPDDKIG